MFYGSTGVVCLVTDICVYFDIFGDEKLSLILFLSVFSLILSDIQFIDSYI